MEPNELRGGAGIAVLVGLALGIVTVLVAEQFVGSGETAGDESAGARDRAAASSSPGEAEPPEVRRAGEAVDAGGEAATRDDAGGAPRATEGADAGPTRREPDARGAAGGETAAAGEPEQPAWRIPAELIDPDRAERRDGRLVQELDDGTEVVLTLHPELQDAAESALTRHDVYWGSVVAVEPDTGHVLALAEHSRANPDAGRIALQADGPAASIFKLVTAAALLERAGLSPEARICTRGGHSRVRRSDLRSNPDRDEVCETFAEALGQSRNTAFARWAHEHLEPRDLRETAESFGFEQPLPFLWTVGTSKAEIPEEPLAFGRAAAGFVGTSLSPLHGALIGAAVANGGEMMAPRLVAKARRDDEVLYEAGTEVLMRSAPEQVADRLATMMVETTESGTAEKRFERRGNEYLPDVDVAGKTGTLRGEIARDGREGRLIHTWFVGFVPAEAPRIAVAALVAHRAKWRTKGTIAARRLLQAWYQGPRKKQAAR